MSDPFGMIDTNEPVEHFKHKEFNEQELFSGFMKTLKGSSKALDETVEQSNTPSDKIPAKKEESSGKIIYLYSF